MLGCAVHIGETIQAGWCLWGLVAAGPRVPFSSGPCPVQSRSHPREGVISHQDRVPTSVWWRAGWGKIGEHKMWLWPPHCRQPHWVVPSLEGYQDTPGSSQAPPWPSSIPSVSAWYQVLINLFKLFVTAPFSVTLFVVCCG